MLNAITMMSIQDLQSSLDERESENGNAQVAFDSGAFRRASHRRSFRQRFTPRSVDHYVDDLTGFKQSLSRANHGLVPALPLSPKGRKLFNGIAEIHSRIQFLIRLIRNKRTFSRVWGSQCT